MSELTPYKKFQYNLGEPPRRSELPETVGGLIRFTRSTDGHEDARIVVDTGVQHELEQRIVYHSPSGLEFGYGGSGPADTALNILARIVSWKEAHRMHQDFKDEFIARIPREGGTLEMQTVLDWVRTRYLRETGDAQRMKREAEMLNDDGDPTWRSLGDRVGDLENRDSFDPKELGSPDQGTGEGALP